MMMKVTKNAFDDDLMLSPSGVVFRMGRAHNAYREHNFVNISFMYKERAVEFLL